MTRTLHSEKRSDSPDGDVAARVPPTGVRHPGRTFLRGRIAMEPRFLTIGQVAEALRVGETTIRAAI